MFTDGRGDKTGEKIGHCPNCLQTISKLFWNMNSINNGFLLLLLLEIHFRRVHE